MDATVYKSAKNIVKYSDQALQSFETRRKKIVNFINKKLCPDEGWSEEEVEIFLHEIAMMDSNNFLGSCGLGERESRFASRLVARRHYNMGHGIGRSGDITEIQPKAAGSSLIGQLVNSMLLDLLRDIGLHSLKKCIVVPLATGMSMLLCLRTLHNMRPTAKYVIWPRIDQKSCFKCILSSGLQPIIVKNDITEFNGMHGSIPDILVNIQNLGAENIVCVLSTVSSFAPKIPDKLLEIGQICAKYDIPHLVNNAYGIQCTEYLQSIEKASKTRVDLFVSSTDKNFMVPVGGSVICGFDENLIELVAKTYPGRGSGIPSTDLFITLLNLGKSGYMSLLQEREQQYTYLKSELVAVAQDFGCEIQTTPENCLSVAFNLCPFESLPLKVYTEIGSMLFSKFVMGTRLVAPGDNKIIAGYEFKNWGAHTDGKFVGYLTASAAIGVKKSDVDTFIKHFRSVLSKAMKHVNQNVLLKIG